MRNFKFSMPIRLVSLVVALLLLISIFPMSIFATDKDVAAVNGDIDAVPVGEVADVATISEDVTEGYYLVGQLNGQQLWNNAPLTNDRKLNINSGNAGEYMLDWTFYENDELKVVYYNGTGIETWYGGGDNYIITADEAGECTLYFNPAGNSAWSYNYIYILKKTAEPEVISDFEYYVGEKKLEYTPYGVQWAKDAVTVKFTVAEGYDVEVKDGDDKVPSTKDGNTASFTVDCNEGGFLNNKKYTITATKDAETVTKDTDNIHIDKVLPTISEVEYFIGNDRVEPNEENAISWTNQNVTVKFKVVESHSKINNVKVNGEAADYNHVDNIYSYTFKEECNKPFDITATDNAGNEAKDSTVTISIDKTAPEIYDVKYYAGKEELTPEKGVLPWTNKDVTVKFKIFEAPAENCGSGIDFVTVDNKTITETDGVYSYTEKVGDEKSFDENISIVVKDCAGNQGTVDTSEIRIDKIKPVISDVKYYTVEEENGATKETELVPVDGSLPWTNKKVVAKFNVTDEDSGVKSVKIGDTSLTPESEKNGVYSYSHEFKIDENSESVLELDELTITAKDVAGNSADEKKTAKVRIEDIAPVAEAYIFPISAKDVLNFLSFGIYGNAEDVQVTVRAYDKHSDIKEVYLYYKDGNQVESSAVNEQLEKMVKSGRSYATFTLRGVYAQLYAVAVDNAGNISDGLNFSNGKKYFSEATDDLAELFGASFDEASFDQASFDECTPDEIVISDAQPGIEFSYVFPKETNENVTPTVEEIAGVDWYNCAVSITAEINALDTKLKEVRITRDAPVDDYDYDQKFDFTKEATTKYSDTFNAAGDGYNKITVTAQSNNTQSSTGSYEYYIDTTAPVIKEIKYTDGKGNKLSGSEELSWVDSNVTVDFTVEEQGSGIKVVRISDTELTPVSVENGVYSYSYTIDVDDADTFADGFTIYAEDKVRFSCEENTATVCVDKVAPVISDVNYTDDKGNVLDPAEDLAWINKDVIVEFTVKEKGSGIKVVKIGDTELTPESEKNGTYRYSYIIEVADADSFVGDFVICAEDNVGLNDSKTTSNIRIDKIKPVVETFIFKKTVDTVISFLTFGIYSCEDIEVIVKATDEVDSSGIKSVALYDGKTLLGKKEYEATSSDISEVFTLAEGRYTHINAVVKDSANNSSGKTDMDNNNAYASQDEVYQIVSPTEIVVSDEQPDVTLTHPENEVVTVINDMPWYNADVKFGIEVKAPETKLQNVAIALNDADITNAVIGAQNYANTPITDVAGGYTVSEDGKYTIDVVANSNNNTPAVTKSYTFSLDKTAPVISDVTYYTLNTVVNETTNEETVTETQVDPESSWFSEDIRIKFNVTEQGSGIKVVKIGDTELTPVSVANGVYSYSYDINVADNDSFNKIFTIYAEDMVNWSAEINTAAVRIDKVKPSISEVTYTDSDGNEVTKADELAWINKDVIVSFTVTEKHSGIKVVKIGDTELTTPTPDENGVYSYTYTIEVADAGSFVGDFVIYAEDNVGFTDEETTSTIRIDKINPVVETFTFEKTVDTVISFLTFGIYSCDDIKVTVKATDAKDSSGIRFIALYDGETQLDSKAYDGTSSDISEVFTLAEGRYTNINAVAIDIADNNSGVTVMEEVINAEDDSTHYFASPDEIVVSGEQPDVTLTHPENEVVTVIGDMPWYKADVKFGVEVKAPETKLQNVIITLDGRDITHEVIGAQNYANTPITDVAGDYTVSEDGPHTIEVTANSNNNTPAVTKSYTFSVDKVAPAIQNITYKEVGGQTLIPNADGSLPWTNKNVVVDFEIVEEHSGISAVTIGGLALDAYKVEDGVYYYSYTKSVATGGSFDQALEIYAQDNVANDSKLNTAVINIDKIAPTIAVEYDNPDHKVYQGNEYYKANRTATITVVERNFDPSKFTLDITNTDGTIPALSGWSVSGSHDSTTHTATVTFANDGDYTMTMDCTDAVGNKADVKPEMQKFTIDKTLPTVDVTFDNNSALNNAYYSSDRTATITINEHNFAVDAEHLTVNVTATAGDNTTSVTPPAVVDWSHSGDVHTARIHFTEDGSYEITVDFKDFAYNEAEQFVVDKFYIDETKPEIQFNQVENNVAYGGVIAPQVIMTDNNYDTYTTFTLQRIDIDSKAMDVELYRSSVSNGDSGETITYSNFPEVELNDGIYKLTVRIVDKAGNEDSKEIVFSVNRFGSTYMAGDENTSSLIADGYTNAEQDIVIKEINVNKVSAQKMSLALNNANISELVANKDYSVKTIGGENSWYEYSYTILKENFKEEGFYTLTLSSTDRVKHTVSNRTALTDERKYPVSFTVDKTLPGIRITGVESNEPYKDAQRDVKVVYEDANIDPEKMTIKLNGEILKAGEDYELNTDNAGEAVASFKVKAVGKNTKQNIEVVVIDKADNENTLSVSDFILSASWFRRFLANTPLAITVFSILGVGIILLIVLLAKKRKQEE